jgi:hypothetical protein
MVEKRAKQKERAKDGGFQGWGGRGNGETYRSKGGKLQFHKDE